MRQSIGAISSTKPGNRAVSEAPWYDVAFRAGYLHLYAHRTDERALAEVEFVTRHLSPMAGALVLDLCCGNGRHAAAMTARGAQVIGLDYSEDLLCHARTRNLSGAKFLRADMMPLPLVELYRKRLDPMLERAYDEGEEVVLRTRFQWLLLPLIGLILLEMLMQGGSRR